MHACDRQTDGRTDRQTDGQNYDSQDRPRMCSRGKNEDEIDESHKLQLNLNVTFIYYITQLNKKTPKNISNCALNIGFKTQFYIPAFHEYMNRFRNDCLLAF